MKNRFLILTLIGLFGLAVPAKAELTNADVVSPEYLETHGYSNAMVQAAQKTKARSNGEKYDTYSHKHPATQKGPLKYIRHFFMYLDPAYDDESFMDHDIKTSPTYRDL